MWWDLGKVVLMVMQRVEEDRRGHCSGRQEGGGRQQRFQGWESLDKSCSLPGSCCEQMSRDPTEEGGDLTV